MRRGDQRAFTELYRRRQPGIHRFVWHMAGSRAVADDVTQEVFLAMIRQLDAFDPQRGTVVAYLYAIARRQTSRALRDQHVAVPLEDAPASCISTNDEHPLERLSHEERLRTVRRWLVTLPAHYREALVLCDVQGVDYAAAARSLGCPIGTVRSRLHRARALLLKRLRAVGVVGGV